MITIRLLLTDLTGEMFEADQDVVLNATFEENLTELTIALMKEHFSVLRIELPEHVFPDMQRFLIPSMTGIVSLAPRVPT